jgi:hypothetical protein
MKQLPDHPIQCPDDLDHLSRFDDFLWNNNPANEPCDDWSVDSNNLSPVSPTEVAEMQHEVEARLNREADIQRTLNQYEKLWGSK